MFEISKIISPISKNEKAIIANINRKDLDTYVSIKDEFLKSDVSSNSAFQLKFNSFYRLNGAGLTKEFKSVYFKLMEEKRNNDDFDSWQIKEIMLELFKYKNAQGNNCIHFSFTTKLMHTINNNLPIYDSMIKKVFGFAGPYHYNSSTEKIDSYLAQYEVIKDTYNQIMQNNLLSSTFELFDLKFPNSTLSKIKASDFIFWTAGKLKLFY